MLALYYLGLDMRKFDDNKIAKYLVLFYWLINKTQEERS
jgi:hypothetical protein